MLVRALANIGLCWVPGRGVVFTTMERGYYLVPEQNGDLASAVLERLRPLATARLVIDNKFRSDHEPELWQGDELTRQIGEVGQRLGLLPAPFPVEQSVDERGLRHPACLYSIGGLSYGNLSAHEDQGRFWMSASGVDKAKLVPGRGSLLVSGYDAEAGRIVLSLPANVEPRRVSVDTIEHWMIYQQNPPSGRSSMPTPGWTGSLRPRSTTPAVRSSSRPASPSSSPSLPIPATRSSACATTASRRPARASARSAIGSSRACSAGGR